MTMMQAKFKMVMLAATVGLVVAGSAITTMPAQAQQERRSVSTCTFKAGKALHRGIA